MFGPRPRLDKHTKSSIRRHFPSIFFTVFLTLAALACIWPPQSAFANYVQHTLTGTMNSGTDVTGVFGLPPGTNLTGLSYTLEVTYDDTVGSQSSGTCSGGSPTYVTSNQGVSGNWPAVGAVLWMQGGPIPMVMGRMKLNPASNIQLARRYAPVAGCNSTSTIEFGDQEGYNGDGYSGGGYVADGIVKPPTGGSLTSDPIWNDALATTTNLKTGEIMNFNWSVTFDGSTDSASGVMNYGTTSTAGSLTITVSAAPGDPPASTVFDQVNLGGGGSGGGSGSGPGSGSGGSSGAGPEAPTGQSCPGTAAGLLCGNPVNAATGNKFQPETDYQGAPSTQLSLTRYYNSFNNNQMPFGKGWSSNWHSYITGPTSGVVTVTSGNGKVESFTLSGAAWVPNPNITSELSEIIVSGTQVGWEVLRTDDSIEDYNMLGQLTSVTTRSGLTTTLTYTSLNLTTVTGPFGQTLTFIYDTSGRIATMTDANSKVYTYTYGPYDNLVTVKFPDTKVRAYEYFDPNYPQLLTGIRDELGKHYANFTYDSTGRALTSQHAGGAGLWTLTYNTGGTTTATDALGNAHTYTPTSTYNLQVPSSLSGTPYPPAGGASFTYDTNGFIASRTDFNGNVTTYTHDSRGNETQRIEAYGTALARTITTTWHATFNLPLTITEPARTTTFTYDADGNMLTKSVTDGTHTSTWTYTYNAAGQVLTAEDPDTNVTTYTYNANGTMATMVNAASQTTTYNTYDANSRLTKVTDPNGLITQYTYDYKGRMLTKVVGSLTTTYTYDAAGNMTKLTHPDGSYFAYTYDAAHRLTKITDRLGNHTDYTLDAMGNKTAMNVYNAASTLVRTHTYTYDAMNRLDTDTGAAMGETTTYTYDDQSNLLTVTDPLSDVTTYTYDALNRKSTMVDPASNTTTYGYDSEDNLSSVDDPRGLTTTYGYDGLGRQTSLSGPDTGSTTRTFDAMGNVLTSTDARSDVSTYTYDVLNRLSTAGYTGGASATYTYDTGTYGKGHLTEVADSTGNTQWTFDQYGKVTQRKEVVGAVTLTNGYAYDADERLHILTFPSAKTVTYAYDTQGNISSVTLNSNGVASSVAWMPFGPAKNWTQANGKVFTRTFDQDYRITGLALGTLNTQGLTWDNAGRLTALTETGLSNKSYGYDNMDRLTGITIGTANPTSWSYDDNGNRATTTDPSSNVTTYNYPGGNNKLSSLSGFVTQSFTYDANGNMTGDGTNTWTYDQRGRMATNVVGAVTTTYSVNDIGLRVKKAGATTTLYAYDEAGHTVGEYTSTGTPVMETAFMGNLAVGVMRTVSGTTTTDSLAPDWIGAPHIIANISSTFAWTWDHLAWGDDAPNQNPGGLGTFVYDWRFPGQIYDLESGLFYNRARDYSSALGRYVESDPIGLRGGDYSTYGYVKGNPLRSSDPKGLSQNNYGGRESFDAANWTPVNPPVEYGDELAFSYATSVIGIEASSSASPLPTNQFEFTVQALPLQSDGKRQTGVSTPGWLDPVPYGSGLTGAGFSNQFVISASFKAPLTQWTIRIPPQEETHDNNDFEMLQVYTPQPCP